MTTMKDLALSKIAKTAGIVKPAAVDKGESERGNQFHDPAFAQRWHLQMILNQKLPVDITLDNGTVMHDAHIVAFDTHTLILQDGEYRVALFKHSVATLRFKLSDSEPKPGTH